MRRNKRLQIAVFAFLFALTATSEAGNTSGLGFFTKLKKSAKPFYSNALAASPVGQPVFYDWVDLDAFNGGLYALGISINSRGNIVGQRSTGDGYSVHAFFFDGTMHDLGTLGGDSGATGINCLDTVVGSSQAGLVDPNGYSLSTAFLYDESGMQAFLGIVPSSALGINNRGQIIGNIGVDGYIYEKGVLTSIESPVPEGEIYPQAINDTGQVVGGHLVWSGGTPVVRAFIYDDGIVEDLVEPQMICPEDEEDCYLAYSQAIDINNRGQIVGNVDSQVALFEDGIVKTLDVPGVLFSNAHAINDSGQIVGFAIRESQERFAFIFEHEEMHDLNELAVKRPDNAPPLEVAYDINNFGQIVGQSFLLNPIYDRIRPDREFIFKEKLGKVLTFEYWISLSEEERELRNKMKVLIQAKVEHRNPTKGKHNLGQFNNQWTAVDRPVPIAGIKEDWRKAVIRMPEKVQGDIAVIRIRANCLNRGKAPEVYVRHFEMEY